MTVVAGPPGSGKTVLLRSWISRAGLSERAAWVPAGRDERDPQHFWLSVVGALRRTTPGSALVQALTAAPDLDGWAIVERLLSDLAPLQEPVWLVVDDVHELRPEALRQLELLVMRAPAGLRFVVAARHDVRLGLHPLRLEGKLAEVRADDLPFSLAEAAELFAAAGLEWPSRRWRDRWSGRRDGRRGCDWRRCRWPGTRTRHGSPRSFPAPSGRWPSICWPRCWTGSPNRCVGCCCGGSGAGGGMAEPVRARRLTDQEGQRLLQIVRRGKHESVRVRRAMIIMASASGTLVPAIARLAAAGEDTVRDVIHAFNAKGLAALDPRWAGGRPRRISDEDIEVIVAAATTRPEKLGQPFTRWSLRKLAGYLACRPGGPVTIGRAAAADPG